MPSEIRVKSINGPVFNAHVDRLTKFNYYSFYQLKLFVRDWECEMQMVRDDKNDNINEVRDDRY